MRGKKRHQPNPLLTKKGRTVYAGTNKLRDVELSGLEENILVIGPVGNVGRVFGFDPETRILCFLENPKNKKILIGIVKGEIEGKIPIFQHYRPIGARGTIESFWAKKTNKLLAGAVQFVPDFDKKIIILTHMAVRAKWRRQLLNTKMIQFIEKSYPGYELLFHGPTEMGSKFLKKYGYKEYKPNPVRGKCVSCSSTDLEIPYTHCKKCRKRDAKRKKYLIARGLCLGCTVASVELGKLKCSECLKFRRTKNKIWRDRQRKPLPNCACGSVVASRRSKLCKDCRIKNIKMAAKLRIGRLIFAGRCAICGKKRKSGHPKFCKKHEEANARIARRGYLRRKIAKKEQEKKQRRNEKSKKLSINEIRILAVIEETHRRRRIQG